MDKMVFDIERGGSSATNLVTDVRKPSKVTAILVVLVILLLVLSFVFIGLYAKEKNDGSVEENQYCSTPERVRSAAGKFQPSFNREIQSSLVTATPFGPQFGVRNSESAQ